MYTAQQNLFFVDAVSVTYYISILHGRSSRVLESCRYKNEVTLRLYLWENWNLISQSIYLVLRSKSLFSFYYLKVN